MKYFYYFNSSLFPSLYLKLRFFLFSLLVPLLLLAPFAFVQADAWWGKGYRSPEWVLANGGAIIYYSVEGAKSEVTAKLIVRGKHNVEREYGSSGIFDDALPNQNLEIKISVKSKSVTSPVFQVRAGEKKYIRFKMKGKKIKYLDSSSSFKPKKKVKSQAQIKKEKIKAQEKAFKEASFKKETSRRVCSVWEEKQKEKDSKNPVKIINKANSQAQITNSTNSPRSVKIKNQATTRKKDLIKIETASADSAKIILQEASKNSVNLSPPSIFNDLEKEPLEEIFPYNPSLTFSDLTKKQEEKNFPVRLLGQSTNQNPAEKEATGTQKIKKSLFQSLLWSLSLLFK